ncbi:MAG: phage tail family protein [Bacteroidota bacterium]|nr:phage tail family protein [Bacteroidota bacterium]
MIKESLYFQYDGVNSSDFNIVNVTVDGNMYNEPFLANRTIKEFTVIGRDKPYFSRVVRDPLSFSINFAFEDIWDDELISNIKQWLNVNYYKPLRFSEDEDKIYYAMCVDSPSITHNGLKEGYVTLNFRCDSPYAYSPEIMTNWYDTSIQNNLTLDNLGDVEIYPQLYITKVGDGDLAINNTSSGSSMQFTNLLDQEELYITCEKTYIETSIPNFYRYDSFNEDWLKLVYGQNNIQIIGNCKVKFQYEYKYL